MKKLILTLLFSLPVLAQHGFRAENGNIIWEKSFPVGSVNVAVLLKAQPALDTDIFTDNECKGSAMDMKIEGDGGTAMMRNNCKFDFDIAIEGNSYVVRIRNMKFLERVGPMQLRTIVSSFEKYFMDERKLRPTPITQGNLAYLDNFFTGIFTGTVISSSEALTSN
jgi:hypothetical protein